MSPGNCLGFQMYFAAIYRILTDISAKIMHTTKTTQDRIKFIKSVFIWTAKRIIPNTRNI